MDRDSSGDAGGRSRRQLLTVLGASALGSLAGCSTLRSYLPESGDAPAGSAAGSPELSVDAGVVAELRSSHQTYLDQLSPAADEVDFDYDPLNERRDVGGESFEARAAPAESLQGDRILVKPPESGADPDYLASLLTAIWGVPLQRDVVTTSVSGTQVTFRGGGGPEIAAAGASTSIPGIGESALVARGETESAVAELCERFEELLE